MSESIQSLINLYGIKGLETYLVELGLESREKEQKMREKVVNGTHSSNT